jgi:hypothetical protein
VVTPKGTHVWLEIVPLTLPVVLPDEQPASSRLVFCKELHAERVLPLCCPAPVRRTLGRRTS